MEWSRAKSILIWLYIGVNLFLSVTLWTLYTKRTISDYTINNTVNALKNRGVLVNCEISRYNKETSTLSYEQYEIDKEQVLKELLGKKVMQNQREYKTKDKEIIFVDNNRLIYKDYKWQSSRHCEDDVIQYVNEVLKKCDIEFRGKIEEEDVEGLVIYEKVGDFCVFGNYVRVSVLDDVLSMEIRYRMIKDADNKRRKIMPVHQVLLKNIVNMEGNVITDIKFGFRESMIGDNIKELDDIPVWRVRLNDSEDIFYKAYTGKKVN